MFFQIKRRPKTFQAIMEISIKLFDHIVQRRIIAIPGYSHVRICKAPERTQPGTRTFKPKRSYRRRYGASVDHHSQCKENSKHNITNPNMISRRKRASCFENIIEAHPEKKDP